jgi:hypothetical protein
MVLSAPSLAQDKNGSKPGFALKPQSVRIILMRPSIHVGAQSTGGMYEPNADWTSQARDNIARALKTQQASLNNEIVLYDEGLGPDATLATQYGNLFGTVADSVIEYQFFKGNRLPTKTKSKKEFDWSVGPEIANLPALRGADYALFINTYDAYGSTGRKVLQAFGMLAGVPITSGVHKGYAGLVDLKTGDLVWLNADRQIGGDVRTEEGAVKRVRELLKGFPGRPAQTTTPTGQ